MLNTNSIRTDILSYADEHDPFKFSELLLYLNGLDGHAHITKSTLSWYLRDLVKENCLFKLGRGIYTRRVQKFKKYVPYLRKKAIRICKKISSEFPLIKVSVLDGQIFADFQHHHSTNNAIYIEVERDMAESVFHFLKKTLAAKTPVYLSPTKEFTYNYIDLAQEVFIVKPLITESPLIQYNEVLTPMLEKIMVDIYCDDDLDYLHGSEWFYMLRNALEKYSLTRTAMLRYASRRNVKAKIEEDLNRI